MPVLKNMLVGSATIASTRSDSRSHWRIFDGPDSAAPLNNGDPLRTMPARPPPSWVGRIFCAKWHRNSICPSPIEGSPWENREPGMRDSFSTASWEAFQSKP